MFLYGFLVFVGLIYISPGLSIMAGVANEYRAKNYSEWRIRVMSPFIILGWPVVFIVALCAVCIYHSFKFFKTELTSIYKG